MTTKPEEALQLSQLQNLLKKDPSSYKNDFLKVFEEYTQHVKDFRFSTNEYDERLDELVNFLAQVIHCYPDSLQKFSDTVISTLKEKAQSMEQAMRLSFVKSIIMMKNKGLVPGPKVVELFFGLFKCQDKLLRKTIRTFIIHDVKKANKKGKASKLNSSLQTFLSAMITDSSAVTAREAVLIMVDLYRRNIWKDTKTVNIVTNACFSRITKVLLPALHFFLGADKKTELVNTSDEESETEANKAKQVKQMKLGHRVGRKTRKRAKRLERALDQLKSSKRKKNKDGENENSATFSAVHLINDPQQFAERMFKAVESTRERFDVRMNMLELISRVIGIHQLQVLNFYPFLQRYLTPHQRDVTRLLLFAAQASHDQVPPDVIEPMIRTIADNFITDRASHEAIAVGLNAVREICSRCPFGVGEDLLSDLVEYRTFRDKNVVAAARSLIRLYRVINPSLLPRKERGKPTEAQAELDEVCGANDLPVRQFGVLEANSFIPGAEVLKRSEELVEQEKVQGEWESCSDDNDDNDEWIDVDHSSDEGNTADKPGALKETLQERLQRAENISLSRILSQEEFEQIRRHQKNKETQAARRNAKRKVPHDEVITIDEEEGNGDLVSLSAIERLVKKAHQSKEERIEDVKEGRKDREKYGFKVNRMNPNASTTNREKRKSKPFQMVKHKAARKNSNRSFQEKQRNLRDRLKKVAKFMRT